MLRGVAVGGLVAGVRVGKATRGCLPPPRAGVYVVFSPGGRALSTQPPLVIYVVKGYFR